MVCCLAALTLVIGFGFYLNDIQTAAREKVHQDYADRSRLVAGLVGDTLGSSDTTARSEAERLFAGPESALDDSIADLHAGLAWAVVLRADGSLIAADPPSMAAKAPALATGSSFAQAVKADRLTLGDVTVEPTGTTVHLFQPFKGTDGPRVLVMPAPIEQVTPVLAGVLEVTADHAYVVDAQDNVITSSGKETVGEQRPALAQAGSPGVNYLTTPIPSTTWRVILMTSEEKLLGPLRASERAAWKLFGVLTAAVMLLILIGVVAMNSLHRLAHARAHDALTGLPSRSLFIDRVTTTILEQRRRPSGPTAALFIDLDGFKPVNDTYGHAVGDALLKAVAGRLLESMRPGDYVSRFGGDEFLILCKGLRTESDALAVAERIRQYIAEPFDVGGHKLHIGTSIGIALLDDHADDATSLIHNADLAMYEAKRSGKGRIERFTPDMTSA